jgi:hypothetical protein
MKTNLLHKPNMTLAEELEWNKAILSEASSWSESHPLKASLITSTARAIADIERKQARADQEIAIANKLAADRSAYAALPWYKRIFTTQP